MVIGMVREGLFDDPVMVQLCMGIPYGAPNDPLTFGAMVNNLPPNSVFSAFSIGRNQLSNVRAPSVPSTGVSIVIRACLPSVRSRSCWRLPAPLSINPPAQTKTAAPKRRRFNPNVRPLSGR